MLCPVAYEGVKCFWILEEQKKARIDVYGFFVGGRYNVTLQQLYWVLNTLSSVLEGLLYLTYTKSQNR